MTAGSRAGLHENYDYDRKRRPECPQARTVDAAFEANRRRPDGGAGAAGIVPGRPHASLALVVRPAAAVVPRPARPRRQRRLPHAGGAAPERPARQGRAARRARPRGGAPRSLAHDLRHGRRRAGAGDRSRGRRLHARRSRPVVAGAGRARRRDRTHRPRRGRAPVRPGARTADPRPAAAPLRRRAYPAGHPAPHRVGRVVDRCAGRRSRPAVPGFLLRPAGSAAAAGAAVRRLRRLATRLAARRALARPDRVLDRTAGRRPGAAGIADRPPASCRARQRRRRPPVHAWPHAEHGRARARQAPRRHGVHGLARRLGRPAGAPVGTGRRGDRHRRRQPPPHRGRAADRLLRQHGGVAGARRRRPERRRSARAGARDHDRRLRSPGPALRAGGRGAAAGAQHELHPGVPDHVQHEQHAGQRQRAGAGRPAHRRHRAGQDHHAVRSEPVRDRHRQPARSRDQLCDRAVRRVDRAAPVRPVRAPAGRHGRRRQPARQPPAAAVGRRARPPAGRPQRYRRPLRRTAGTPPVRGPGRGPAGCARAHARRRDARLP